MDHATHIRQDVGRHGLVTFLVLAYGISWLALLPALLAANDIVEVPGWLTRLRHLATFGPGIAAFVLLFRSGGRADMRRLWRRGWSFSFDKRWLVPVFGIPILMTAATVAGITILGDKIPWQHGLPPAMFVPIFLILYLTNALPEEYGWRGFALDRLQVGRNALLASLILGLMHGLWHLPLHFIEGTTQEIIPVWEFVLMTIAGAVVYTWLFNNTGGSVFVVALYHAFSNTLTGAVPWWTTTQGRWVGFGAHLAVAVVIVAAYGARRLTRGEDAGVREPPANGPAGGAT